MTKTKIKFSVIIPTYNSANYVITCLDSLSRQNFSQDFYEVIVVDDKSNDDTVKTVKSYKKIKNLRVIELKHNGGPGHARNKGIDNAIGEWLSFIDSDDLVTKDYLYSLNEVVSSNRKNKSLAAIGFNWSREKDGKSEARKDFYIGRRDGYLLTDSKKELLRHYLSARMDGSSIYTLMKKDLLDKHSIRFEKGLHEDIDFIYKVYQFSLKLRYLDKAIYIKKHRSDSIINTISKKHIIGFVRAWLSIGKALRKAIADKLVPRHYLQYYSLGLTGMIASRVKEINRHCRNPRDADGLYKLLFDRSRKLITIEEIKNAPGERKTSYFEVALRFFDIMGMKRKSMPEKRKAIRNFLNQLEGKSWSCQDLNHSLFLRADEVNTCCRRFFVNNKRRGDVTILSVTEPGKALTTTDILNSKRDLHYKINCGIPNPCDHCPYLEFKRWSPINKLDIHHLSMEHHSICNLRCIYCGEDYYGGMNCRYMIKETVRNFYDHGALDNCHTIVWGGGEPTLDRKFDALLNDISQKLPNAKHRIVTNAVRFSESIDRMLSDNKMQATVSIDAGSRGVYKAIRGRDYLEKVFINLRKYASTNPKALTIKYVFTKGNGSLKDINNFVGLIKDNGLQECLFQISMDFKYAAIDNKTLRHQVILYGLLRKIGCSNIFFDEIILQRLMNLGDHKEIDVEKICSYVGIDFIALPKNYSSVIIWGASLNAKNLMEKSMFFKHVDVTFFVDSNKDKHRHAFCDKPVRPPSSLRRLNEKKPILITAVQGYSSILTELAKMNYSSDHIIDKLII